MITKTKRRMYECHMTIEKYDDARGTAIGGNRPICDNADRRQKRLRHMQRYAQRDHEDRGSVNMPISACFGHMRAEGDSLYTEIRP